MNGMTLQLIYVDSRSFMRFQFPVTVTSMEDQLKKVVAIGSYVLVE